MDTASETFGRQLRTQRERRGIMLDAIIASTKIKGSLLRDLERGDVSKWPHGIFRRAFVREYAASIGLEPESVVREFVRLFPDEESGDPQSREEANLRLTLADEGRTPVRVVATRVATAFVEVCGLVALVGTLTWVTGLNFWTVCGAASLTYYGIASAALGQSPALWCLDRVGRPEVAGGQPLRTGARSLLELLLQQTAMAGEDGDEDAISSHGIATEHL